MSSGLGASQAMAEARTVKAGQCDIHMSSRWESGCCGPPSCGLASLPAAGTFSWEYVPRCSFNLFATPLSAPVPVGCSWKVLGFLPCQTRVEPGSNYFQCQSGLSLSWPCHQQSLL